MGPWIPAGLVYIGVGLALMVTWVQASGRGAARGLTGSASGVGTPDGPAGARARLQA